MTATSSALRGLRQWAGVLTGPIVFLIDLEARYALVPATREPKHLAAIRLVSVAGIALIDAALFGASRELRATRADEGDGPPKFGHRFLAQLGVWTSAFFLLVVVANAIPTFFLTPED